MASKKLSLGAKLARTGSLGSIFLLTVTLFPFGWLGTMWPGFEQVTDRIFSTELAHVIGHLILYALLGMAILHTKPHLATKAHLYLLLVLIVGLLQESLQLVTFKQRLFGVDELSDIAVDLLGAAVALRIYVGAANRH
jgi:VanZ family protein